MMRVSQKLYREQVRLAMWFAAVTLLSLIDFLATYLWLHNTIMLVGALMVGPIFLLLTLVFLGFSLDTKLKLKK
jgi:hypothetical protein